MTDQVILPVTEITVYIIKTHVAKLEEKFVSYFNPATNKIENIHSLGWYIHFEGSTESIYLSDERPDFEVGDAVEIRIRKVK